MFFPIEIPKAWQNLDTARNSVIFKISASKNICRSKASMKKLAEVGLNKWDAHVKERIRTKKLEINRVVALDLLEQLFQGEM